MSRDKLIDEPVETKIIGFKTIGIGYARRRVPILKRIGDMIARSQSTPDILRSDD